MFIWRKIRESKFGVRRVEWRRETFFCLLSRLIFSFFRNGCSLKRRMKWEENEEEKGIMKPPTVKEKPLPLFIPKPCFPPPYARAAR